MTVSIVVLGPEVVDFQWNNGGCSASSYEDAHGYLRGDLLFLRMNDEDTKIDIACRVLLDKEASTFCITDVHGLHTGMTLGEDRIIDMPMLQYDVDIRRLVTKVNWAGETTNTHFQCIHVISEMLRTQRPGWSVAFKAHLANSDACPLLNCVLASHITLIMEGVTHVRPGLRQMVYM